MSPGRWKRPRRLPCHTVPPHLWAPYYMLKRINIFSLKLYRGSRLLSNTGTSAWACSSFEFPPKDVFLDICNNNKKNLSIYQTTRNTSIIHATPIPNLVTSNFPQQVSQVKHNDKKHGFHTGAERQRTIGSGGVWHQKLLINLINITARRWSKSLVIE